MADPHQHQHPYGLLPDLSHFANGRTLFQVNPETPEPYFFQGAYNNNNNNNNETAMRQLLAGHEMVLPPRFAHHHPAASNFGMINNESSGNNSCSRWPRQETLTLLEIRSRLDSKFKESNQKKPFWDEVSRIMAEEHGYYRSEKKCREKFANLYKYYKKTKDGKAGRQDGKHYRFFRQLEALYGENGSNSSNLNNDLLQNSFSESHQLTDKTTNQEAFHHHQSLSNLSNSSEFETASSGNNNSNDDDLSAIAYVMNQRSMEKQAKMMSTQRQIGKRVKRSGDSDWEGKMKEFVDEQMRELMEAQEAWMERMLNTIEVREQERLLKDEEWRKQEMARLDQMHEFWARERARLEARDSVLMGALIDMRVSTEKETLAHSSMDIGDRSWNDDHQPEILNLMQLITSFEHELEQSDSGGYPDESIWEEIAAKMGSFGHHGSAFELKEKWEKMKMRHYDQRGQCSGQIAKQRLQSMEVLHYNNNENNSYAGNYQGHDEISCLNIDHQQVNEGQQQLWEKGKSMHK